MQNVSVFNIYYIYYYKYQIIKYIIFHSIWHFCYLIMFFTVPNVSFQVYAPRFLDRFLESHAVMLQGNSDLKVKEGEVSSRPWQWPINYRVGI